MAPKLVRIAWLPLLAAAAACADHPTAPLLPEPPSLQREELRCVVTVRARTMDCEPPRASGPRANIILGGQGLHVRLTTTNVSYDTGDQAFSADVSVQNLLDQPLGTDGASSYGVKVFFQSGPTVTVGTGTVEVNNPDGTGTFTAADQPYFDYPGVILPRGTSDPKTWVFSMPPTVEAFVFTVFIETQLPAEPSVLHWRLEGGTPVFLGSIWGMHAARPHQVFAVSDFATVLHYDGNYWRALSTGCGCVSFFGVWASAGDDAWAVGEEGTIAHFDGETWTEQGDPDLGLGTYYAVWGTRPDSVWAVGEGGQISLWDGSDWQDFTDAGLTESDLYSVWGAASDDVWAVGAGGTLLQWDGTDWEAVNSPTLTDLRSIRGSGTDDVWAVGNDGAGSVAIHYDGGSWSDDADPDVGLSLLYAIWVDDAGVAWAVGASIMRYDGGWTVVDDALETILLSATGTSGSNVFAGGALGDILRYGGSSWTTMTAPTFTLYGVWAAASDNVWAVGESGTIMHRNATTWAEESSGTVVGLNAVWGSSASDVWAVGDAGSILRRSGGTWGDETSGTGSTLRSVSGSSSSNVIAVGEAGTIVQNTGSGWSGMTSGVTDDLASVWVASATSAFTVGAGGVILQWDGANWTPMTSGVTDDLWGVWGSGPGDVYAVGDLGTVLHYDGNVGLTWTVVSTPADPGRSINAVWGSADDDVLVLADDGQTVLRYDGSTWKTMTSFSPEAGIWLYSLAGTSSRNLYAVGDLGTILHGTR